MKSLKALLLPLALAAVFALTGCAGVGAVLDRVNENQFSTRLSVEYATLKVIDGEPAKAARVRAELARLRQAVAADAPVSVVELVNEVRERIDWSGLDAADALLVRSVLQAAEARLQEKLGVGALNPEHRVALNTLFDWIEAAAAGL